MFHFQFADGFGLGGEIQGKFAESADLGLDANVSAESLHNAMADAQAQSHARAHVLGGKKRIKNLVQVLSLDARTVVANDDETPVIFRPALDGNRGPLVFEFLVS